MKKYTVSFLILLLFYSITSNAQNETKCDSIYSVVDSMPSFPGENPEMIKFLFKHLPITDSIMGNSMGGTIYVDFIVKKNGELDDIKLLRGIHSRVDMEVLRVFRMMPAWIPGKQNGIPVCIRLTLPIRIHLK